MQGKPTTVYSSQIVELSKIRTTEIINLWPVFLFLALNAIIRFAVTNRTIVGTKVRFLRGLRILKSLAKMFFACNPC